MPVFFGFLYFHQPLRGSLVIAVLAVFFLVLYLRRPIRPRSLTFGFVSVLFAIQLVVALMAPLPDWQFSKPLLWMIMLPALFVNYGIVVLAEKILGGLKDTSRAPPEI